MAHSYFSRHRSRVALYTAFAVSLLLITVDTLTSSADITVTNQPASEGRRITPAGALVLDAHTGQPAVGALPVDFVRSPDHTGPDGGGRYLLAVNSGFGLQFSAATNRAQQSLSVIDLNARPAPAVIQNVYFPSPQSVNVGVCFAPQPETDGAYTLYASGGFENKIWILHFQPGAPAPVRPASPGPDTKVEAPFMDISGFATVSPSPRYNRNRAPVYPTGLAISPDGNTLFVANNLDDSLGIITDLRGERKLTRVDLHVAGRDRFIYPYGVFALPAMHPTQTAKVYVSCWNDASVAVIDPRAPERPFNSITVARHPTAMLANRAHTRLYVVNSNADSVSVIDTAVDREIERIVSDSQNKRRLAAVPKVSPSARTKQLSTSPTHIATRSQWWSSHHRRWDALSHRDANLQIADRVSDAVRCADLSRPASILRLSPLPAVRFSSETVKAQGLKIHPWPSITRGACRMLLTIVFPPV